MRRRVYAATLLCAATLGCAGQVPRTQSLNTEQRKRAEAAAAEALVKKTAPPANPRPTMARGFPSETSTLLNSELAEAARSSKDAVHSLLKRLDSFIVHF
jgi:hypothetical protein